MIYVDEKQLQQVEYLFEQSSRGHHVLFENEVIREVFHNKKELSELQEFDEKTVEKHLENLILQPTLVSKRAYLENLRPELFRRVLRTYFSIVENNITKEKKPTQ